MKEFFKSYWTDVVKTDCKWVGEHWIGVSICALVAAGVECSILFGPRLVENVKDKIDEKKNRKEKRAR